MNASTPPPVRTGRASEFSGWQIIVLFGVLALVAMIPVITHPLPPIADYVNHLSRMFVIAAHGHDPNLARFYDIQWQIIPNLMMDLVVPWIARVMNVYAAGQVFLVATFVIMMSGTLALHRALFERWSLVPMLAFPLFYNLIFLTGLMNFLFGVGLLLWGIAIWVRLRERAWPLRYLVSTVFVIALFFCHLSAVGMYGVGLLAFELQRLFAHRRDLNAARLIHFVATGVPFLPILPLLLKSPTWGLREEVGWEPSGKIDGLIMVIEAYSDIIAFALIAVVVAAAVWAARHRLLRIHPFGWFVLPLGLLTYFAMPRTMFATYMADQRLPISFVLMFIACVHLELRHRIVRRGFIALLLTVIVVRVIEVDLNWTELSRETLSFRDSVRRITRGSTILVASASASGGDDVRDLGLVHAACIAMIERSALVTRAFTVRGKQIMHVTTEYADRVDSEDGSPPSIEQLVLAVERPENQEETYWNDWQHDFDYVYMLFTDEDTPNPLPEILTQVYDGGRFRLYKINKPA